MLGLPPGIFVLLWEEGIVFWVGLLFSYTGVLVFLLVETKDLVLVCDRRALCE